MKVTIDLGVYLLLILLFLSTLVQGDSNHQMSNDILLTMMIKEKGVPTKVCWGTDCYPSSDDCMGFDEDRCCHGYNITIINNCNCNPQPSPSPSPSPLPKLLFDKYSVDHGGPDFGYTITDPTIKYVTVVLCGAGGGGGAGLLGSYGGGGGGGACYLNYTLDVKLGDILSGSIGTRGSKGCADDYDNHGGSGTISILRKNNDAVITAYGGGGGGGADSLVCTSGGGGGGGSGGRGSYATCGYLGDSGTGGISDGNLPSGGYGAYYTYMDGITMNYQAANGFCLPLSYPGGYINDFYFPVFCSGAGGGGLYGSDGGSVGLMRGGYGNGNNDSPGGGGGGASAMSRGDDAAGNYFSIGSGGGGATSNDLDACGKDGGDGAIQIYGYF